MTQYKRGKPWFAIVWLVAVMLLVGACGESSSTTTGAETTSTAEAAPTSDESAPPESTSPPSGDPIVLGVLFDGSGGASFYSMETVAGIEIAVEEINAAGGVLGRPLEIKREDDENDANRAPAQARALLENGAVVVLQTSGSASSLQIKPVIAEEQVPGIAVTNLNGEITAEPDHEYMFAFANDAAQMVTVLQDAVSEYSTFGVFTDTSSTGTGLADIYAASLDAVGIEVVGIEAVDVGATDATAQVARIRDRDPEAVWIASQAPSEEALFLRTINDVGWDVPVFQDITAQVPEFWELAGAEALRPLQYVDQAHPDNERTQAFQALFATKHDRPFVSFSAMGYDSVYILKEAIERADSTEGTALRDALEQTDYEASWGQPGYRTACSAENHRCASLEGMVVRGFTDEGTPGEVIYAPSDS